MTQDNIDTASIKMELLGNISYTQADIDSYCFLAKDINPFHKRGRVPLHLVLGTVSGLLFSWAKERHVKLAAITGQDCAICESLENYDFCDSFQRWDISHSLKRDKSYSVHAGIEFMNDKSAKVIFEIRDPDPSPPLGTVVLISHIEINYT